MLRVAINQPQACRKVLKYGGANALEPAKSWGAKRRTRGCTKKKCTNVLLHTAKMIDPRVKSQARGQNNGSRALK